MLLVQHYGTLALADGTPVPLETRMPLNGYAGFSYQVYPVDVREGRQEFFLLVKSDKGVVAKLFTPRSQVARIALTPDGIECTVLEPALESAQEPETFQWLDASQISVLDDLRSELRSQAPTAKLFVADRRVNDIIATVDTLPFSSFAITDGMTTVVRTRRSVQHQVEYWRVACAKYAVVISRKLGAVWGVYVWSDVCRSDVDEVIRIIRGS